MSDYKCAFCSYVYRPERGDRIHDIPPWTDFADLPDSWRCPSCNQDKTAFTEVVKK